VLEICKQLQRNGYDVVFLPHVDLLSFSGHPKGIGALYVRRGTPWRPLMIGGHQEDGRRGGTENVPYIVGLARAMDLAVENCQQKMEQIARLRDRLEAGILEKLPWVQVNGVETLRLPNTTNVSYHYIFPRIVASLRDASPYWDAKNNQPRPGTDQLIVKR